MGGSGGFFPSDRDSSQTRQELQKSVEKTNDREGFSSAVNDNINDLLKEYNSREVLKINSRLEKICDLVRADIEEEIDFKFGGSVNKHTYVDGLSDIDALLVLNKTELKDSLPKAINEYLKGQLDNKLADVAKISIGTLAVTVEYTDGMMVQLLPAIKREEGFKIPSTDGATWSSINPKAFTEHLKAANEKQGGKAVPAIKILKAINAQFPADRQLTGYHIEALAINAFKQYTGPQSVKDLLTHFFYTAKDSVMAPIKDRTGQSIHVDEYLGAKDSEKRKAIKYQFEVISRKIRSADATCSPEQWRNILGEL